ncbi:F-box protein [Canna indica]|uniref:F-box protein n=1 Tax=Canna indica TaxID=4628 RepID=A0AAQ3K3R9_9LILI|nr:F-box protein [Canna indica]
MATKTGISELPHDVISLLISFTSLADAVRLMTILSRAASELVEDASLKQLYFRPYKPILIDDGSMSFALEKSTGAKCLMISPKELRITWGDDRSYWTFPTNCNSRFGVVAELLHVILQPRWRKVPKKAPQTPRMRDEVWMEIEMGQFFNDDRDQVVRVKFQQVKEMNWKRGLIVQGIEFRPKN